jgi:protein O-GlcNAc transferase
MSKGRQRRGTGAGRAARRPNLAGPTSASPWVGILTRARAAARKAQWADADRLYREVVAQQPDQLEALEALGVVALAQRQPERAVAWLDRARRGAPRNARLLALLGRAQRQSGASAEAIETQQKALALDARQAYIWVELGLAQFEARSYEAAVNSCLRALELEPEAAAPWHLASQAFGALGKLSEALRSARQALLKDPWYGEAHLNQGSLLERSGVPGAALVSFFVAAALPETSAAATRELERLASELEASTPAGSLDEQLPELKLVRELLGPTPSADAALALAHTMREQQRLASAILCYERSLALGPSLECCRELAELLWQIGQAERAQQRALDALQIDPRDVATYRALGAWLASNLVFTGGESRWQRLLEQCPDDVVALVNLGVAAQRMGRPSEAVPLQRRALQLRPDLIEPYINLAAALCDQGSPAQASAAHRQALAIDPTRWAVHSNLLLNAHFDPNLAPEALLAQHREFGRALSEWLGPVRQDFVGSPEPSRRLRIGYVSPDFCEHPVAYFLEPVLREHDSRAFEIYCYSDVVQPDATTARLRERASVYRACAQDTDDTLAERIRRDQIDILVDLAGHGLNNRMPVFARKPAPVQVTWLGYFDTTGLGSMDYRIADLHSVPEGAERWFVERVLRLPRSSTCFLPPANSPEPQPPPCLKRGYLSFGCFSNPSKITRDVTAVFGRILRALPHSRLLLKYHTCADPGVQARFLRWFAEEGIARDRIQFQSHSPIAQYLAAFSEIDVALDPFPYSGETTALHTLWMGVPLVAWEGRTLAERLASRVLRVAGLHDCVAHSSDEYARIAQRLASDPTGLTALRRGLRERLQTSPLLDHRGVTRDLEAAYREIWQRWCASASASAETSVALAP